MRFALRPDNSFQYFSMMQFEELKSNKEQIKDQIVAFFEEKKKYIKLVTTDSSSIAFFI